MQSCEAEMYWTVQLTARDISFINIFGTHLATRADALKNWGGAGCVVKSVSLTDAVGTMLSPTVGILTFKGAADGSCYGQKVGPIWGTSVYVEEGDTWKWTLASMYPHAERALRGYVRAQLPDRCRSDIRNLIPISLRPVHVLATSHTLEHEWRGFSGGVDHVDWNQPEVLALLRAEVCRQFHGFGIGPATRAALWREANLV
jgi:hypothetical protein